MLRDRSRFGRSSSADLLPRLISLLSGKLTLARGDLPINLRLITQLRLTCPFGLLPNTFNLLALLAIWPPVALIGDWVALIFGHTLALVGQTLALVSNGVALVRDLLTLVRDVLPPVGGALALV